jgi:hypothetical protein
VPLSFKFWFVNPNNSWFLRGGAFTGRSGFGVFAFENDRGQVLLNCSFRAYLL